MEILASRVLFRPTDYPRSLNFYRDAIGLAIARDYGAGMVFYAGQSLIELAGHSGGQVRSDPGGGPSTPPADAPPFPGALWLQVRDVYATQSELEGRGVEIARRAKEEPWGLHEMHVTDPDGVSLIFVQVPESHPLRRDTRG
jgi:catechol 2,3-dioxygenase-like lactoylglutathione lyase family enzyme